MRESYVGAGEMGTAECGLCERSQTAHLTPLRVTNFCEDCIIIVDQVDYSRVQKLRGKHMQSTCINKLHIQNSVSKANPASAPLAAVHINGMGIAGLQDSDICDQPGPAHGCSADLRFYIYLRPRVMTDLGTRNVLLWSQGPSRKLVTQRKFEGFLID
jgi:hypothetical protein